FTFPTPDGPVITSTGGAGLRRRCSSAPPHERNELATLALGQAANGLARRDLALGQNLVDLHAPVLGNREQQVEHLRGLQILRRRQQQLVDRLAAALQITLQLCPATAYVICPLKRLHP